MQSAKSGFYAIRLALAAGTALASSVACAQTAPAGAAAEPAAPVAPAAADIVVTGFRQSLQAALNLKKSSVSAVDAIVSEDIAKFPDQNLAESLQRISGVAITRDGGEGRQITVRGLGSQFTVTRVNGLPAQSTSMLAGSGGSPNRDRSFDFNVFASELFKSLVVHKTAEANLDEGSLGAVVDLNTGHPLGAKTGLTGLVSASGSYNSLSGNVGPRLAGLLNWKNEDGTLGANISAAYTKGYTLELGNNTTRWAQAPFASVTSGGVTTNCFSGSTYVQSTACNQAALAFHPRIPRYGVISHDRQRLGITGAIEWQPDDATHLEIDGLFSRYHEERQEEWAEVLFRSNEKGISVINPTYDSNGNMVSGTFNNAYQRNEHYRQIQNSTFYQFDAHLTHDLTDRLKVDVLAGASKSVLSVPLATTVMFDNRTAQNYYYNYANMQSPVITFGSSVTDPANYQLAEIRDAPTHTNNTFRTFKTDFDWKTTDNLTLKTGGFYRLFGFDTWGANRNTLVCPSTLGKDLVLGTITCSSNSVTNNGFPVTSAMVDTVNLGNAGQPAGTTSSFIVANLPATTAFTNLYNRPLVADTSNTRSVKEADSGFFLEGDWKTHAIGMDITLDAGIRYAHTDQSSTGLQNGTNTVTIQRSYHDWLPSANLNFFPRKDVIVRFAVAKVMTRPSLGNLTPGGSVDSFNYKVSYGNPYLDPYRATNYDAAVEWYFAPQSLLSAAFFYKDVASFPSSTVTQGTFASTGLPTSILSPGSPAAQNPEGQVWTITSVGNGTGATLKGVELGLQMPLRFLPGMLKNFGVIGNVTLTSSNATYNVSGAGTAVKSNGTITLPSTTVSSTFFGLSKTTWNATLYYEQGPFQGRVSYSYRGPYNDQNSGTGNIFEGYGAYASLDAALRYSITKRFEISVDATNLLDRYTYHWTDYAAQRNYEDQHTGRTIVFGARYKL
ncbi:MAG: TonB-dependent receptor [Sphingomonadales bacterium]|nr:TonB-dependent receptor [Sphingomonadales bacterium]MDE2168161.1 TonB-dependent receptor [Sphingomonadales bacterium]